jgi:pilus assembly protein CpaE
MTTYLLAPGPKTKEAEAIEAQLKDTIPQLRKIGKLEEIAAEINAKAGGKIIVIFVSPFMPAGGIDSFIDISRRYREKVFFILVSNEISAIDYKRLIRSGGADWVAASSAPQEIPEIIYRQNARSDSEPAASGAKAKPTIVSFLPSVGGVGNTTIALEVALHIKLAKTSRNWKICYVDLDFQTSHVCDYLDIEARLQIHDLIDQPERLDEQLFELFISHHSCGLDVFAAPRSKIDPCQINVSALDVLLEMILHKYDFIVLALPVPWFSWTVPTLENSDAVIMTGINSIPCLRQMRTTLDEVLGTKARPSQVAIVINRATRNLVGRIERRNHVENVLAKENIFYVREDPQAVERANTGTPAALGGPGRSVKDFAKIASFCAGVKLMAARKTVG